MSTMDTFTLFNAGRIVAGAGSLSGLPELAADFKAKRVLVAGSGRCGRSRGSAARAPGPGG